MSHEVFHLSNMSLSPGFLSGGNINRAPSRRTKQSAKESCSPNKMNIILYILKGLTMVYNTQKYKALGLRPASGILKTM
jgi:hypothetical protein